MGIPGLTIRLKPYVQPVQWSKRQENDLKGVTDTNSSRLIIDGPSLAYYIYSRCFSNRTSSKHAIEAFPSYNEIAGEVISWLQVLETFGLIVDRIFFDGDLPESKTGIRLERLQKCLIQLKSFQSVYPEISSTLTPGGARRDRRALPALTFLVPIVIEALLTSKFAKITTVVSGEADLFCALAAYQRPASLVLTNDSDLLVQCPDACVLFFNDFEYESREVLKAMCYEPSDIAAKLRCANFRNLAFCMANDPHMSAQESASIVGKDEGSIEVQAEAWYRSLTATETSSIRGIVAENGRRYLESLDPRISELIHDWARAANQKTSEAKNRAANMYLPFLIDDPSRASAWRLSLDLRSVAYSILHTQRSFGSISEFDRRGGNVTAVTVMPLLGFELTTACTDVLDSLEPLKIDSSPETAALNIWLKYAVTSVIAKMNEGGIAVPPLNTVLAFTSNKKPELTWAMLHFSAQVQGMLYSLRILHAILNLSAIGLIQSGIPQQDVSIVQRSRRIKGLLDTLPSLEALMTRPGEGLAIEDGDGSFRRGILTIYGTTEEKFVETQRQPKRRRRRKKSTTRAGEAQVTGSENHHDSNNIYTLLTEA